MHFRTKRSQRERFCRFTQLIVTLLERCSLCTLGCPYAPPPLPLKSNPTTTLHCKISSAVKPKRVFCSRADHPKMLVWRGKFWPKHCRVSPVQSSKLTHPKFHLLLSWMWHGHSGRGGTSIGRRSVSTRAVTYQNNTIKTYV